MERLDYDEGFKPADALNDANACVQLAAWFHRVALLNLPPVALEIERKILHALRDAISVGYRTVNNPFFEIQKIILRLLTDASELVKPLSEMMFQTAEEVHQDEHVDLWLD